MSKTAAFSSRNLKEILREPLSYVFCLGFPLIMLVVMTLINDSIPAAPGAPTMFRIDNLAGGIAVFGLTFLMLFTALTISKDRSGAFLMRLYSTPMTSVNFISGYMLPTLGLGLLQVVITFGASLVIAGVKDTKLDVLGLLLAAVVLMPTIIMFISFGLLFGTILSEKAAPGICSVIISFGSFLGGIFFDVDTVGGALEKICNVLPFIHSVKAARLATALNFDGIWNHLLIAVAYSVVVTALAIITFKNKMKADLG